MGWEVVQSSSMRPISMEPWAECGPSWDLGPRAPACSGGGPDTMLTLSRHWDPSFPQTLRLASEHASCVCFSGRASLLFSH